MNEPTLNTLTQRLDRLERENRRLKLAGAIRLLALAAVGAMGQVLPKAVPKVVEAEGFALLDAQGKLRAVLSTSGAGLALSLMELNRVPRANLALSSSGEAALSLVDLNAKRRIFLGIDTSGAPRLEFFDKDGKPIWRAADRPRP